MNGFPLTAPAARRASLFSLFSVVVVLATAFSFWPMSARAEESAEEPAGAGWMLHAGSFPTNLAQGVNQASELQTAGQPFTLAVGGVSTGALSNGASASQIAAALEALPAVGANNVSVTETSPGQFRVEYVGLLGSSPQPELEASEATASLLAGGEASGTVRIHVYNVGAGASDGEITVTDTLPTGVVAKYAGALRRLSGFGAGWGVRPKIAQEEWDCSGNGPGPAPSVAGASVVTCRNDPATLPSIAGGGGLPVEMFGGGGANPQPQIGIAVEAQGEVSPRLNQVVISGGGAPTPAATSNIMTTTEPNRAGVVGWDAWASNRDGSIDTRAGSHPYAFTTEFELATGTDNTEERNGYLVGGEARDVEVHLPPGFIGNLRNVPQCKIAELAPNEAPSCPQSSIVGRMYAYTEASIGTPGPLFNMEPPAGEVARLGFNFAAVPVFIDFTVRSGGDYGITAHVHNIAQRLAVGASLTVWGDPEDPTHDRWRGGGDTGCSEEELNESPPAVESYCTRPQHRADHQFLSLPTSCGAPQSILFRQTSGWQIPDAHSEMSVTTHDSSGDPVGYTNCDSLTFLPTLTTRLESATADSPVGLEAIVNASLGGLEESNVLRSSDLAATTVELPPGFTINPGQASGLSACTPSQAGLEPLLGGVENDGPAACPSASEVGSVLIRSPLIESVAEKQIEGHIYVLQSNPPDVRLLIAGSADGVNIKLPGVVHLDTQTGQLKATFSDTPQLPFSEFKLRFNGGAHAAVVTPPGCGEYNALASFTPWASPFLADTTGSGAMDITAGTNGGACVPKPLPFTPKMHAGTTNPTAGGSSAFGLNLSKPDDQQNIKSIDMTLPEGQLAKLAGVPLCPAADTVSGNCPSGSQVGSVSAAVGPGANPLQVPQPGKAPTAVYLAGPYKGAPYSVVIKVPAQAGPFDLGTVSVRAGLYVDQVTTQVTAKSDPLPQILAGVPLEYSSVTVNIDRPGFIQNPTNCEKMAVTGTVSGSEGASANLSNRYQIGDCASLGFKPGLSIHLKGGTKRNANPALKAVVTYPKKGAYANIARASVGLPHSEFLDQAHIGTVCTRVQFAAGTTPGEKCPKASIYGRARASTPLLDKPLSGLVYLRSSNHTLPDLVASLNGQINIVLDGRIDTDRVDGIRTTFEGVPDAPISKFTLEMQGGKKGLLVNSENICSKPQRAIVKLDAQNGKVADFSPLIGNSCGGKAKGKHKG